jgi:hypothetical protein
VTWLAERLLGVRQTVVQTSTTARWFDQRHTQSLWHDINAGASRRGFFEEGPEQERPSHASSKQIQEEKHMDKVSGIGRFLELGNVVQGGGRGPRWFSLPGSWRAPRIQIMRRHDPVQPSVVDERRTARMLTPAEGRW